MKKAGDVLKNFLESAGISDPMNYSGLFKSWREIAGAEFLAHSRLVDIRKGILVVEVDHPGWMQKLQFQQNRIVKSIARKFPELEVTDMAFRMVKEFTPPTRSTAQESVIEDEIIIDSEVRDEDKLTIPENKDPAFIASMESLKKAMKANPKLDKSRRLE